MAKESAQILNPAVLLDDLQKFHEKYELVLMPSLPLRMIVISRALPTFYIFFNLHCEEDYG